MELCESSAEKATESGSSVGQIFKALVPFLVIYKNVTHTKFPFIQNYCRD